MISLVVLYNYFNFEINFFFKTFEKKENDDKNWSKKYDDNKERNEF
jgi:hypothetical protein